MIAIILQVICSLLAWLLLYGGFRYWNKHRSPEWNCRLVTFLHGLIVTFFSGYIVLVDGPWPLTHAGYPNTVLQVWLVCLTLGYFLFDLSWCIYFKSEGNLMLSHHMLSVCGLGFVLMIGKSATEINAIIFVSEITNPLLQLRWFLREMGHYHGLLGDVVDYLFIALFMGMRITGGAWIVKSVMTSSKTMWMLRGGILAMYLVSWGFMLDIISFARRKATKQYSARKDEKMKVKFTEGNGHLPTC